MCWWPKRTTIVEWPLAPPTPYRTCPGSRYQACERNLSRQNWPLFRIQVNLMNPDPDSGYCWIRIQSGCGSRPRFLWQRTNCFKSKTIIYVFLNPYKGHSGFRRNLQSNRELFNHEISSFFPIFGDNLKHCYWLLQQPGILKQKNLSQNTVFSEFCNFQHLVLVYCMYTDTCAKMFLMHF